MKLVEPQAGLWVLTLDLSGMNEKGTEASLEINSPRIGCLNFREGLSIRRMRFQNVQFSRRYSRVRNEIGDSSRFEIPQLDLESMALLHVWSKKQGNTEVAHIARGSELGIELNHAKGFYRFILTLWKWSSDFGLRPWYAIYWILGLTMAMVALLYFTGTSLGLPKEEFSGWRNALVGCSIEAQFFRALIGSIESIGSPFSILGVRRLVVAEHGLVALAQAIHSYAYLFLLFMFGLESGLTTNR